MSWDRRKFDVMRDVVGSSQTEGAEGNQKDGSNDVAFRVFMTHVPEKYKKAEMSELKGILIQKAKAFFKGASGILLGDNGIGKTFMAWALCKAWVRKGETAMVFKAIEVLSDIKTALLSGEDPCVYIRDNYGKDLKHLIIDEIDKIKGSEADFQFLSYLIDYRDEWAYQTIVLGNKSEEKTIVEMLGQSSYSRLSAEDQVSWLQGEDKRRIYGKDNKVS